MKPMRLCAGGIAALALLGAARAPSAPADGFPLTLERSVPIATPGTPAALAVSRNGERVVLGVGRAVSVYAAADATPRRTLELPGTVVGLQLALQRDRAYAALREPAQIAVIDPDAMQVRARWHLPAVPSDLLLDPDEHLLFAASDSAHRLFALDVESGRVRASLALDGRIGQMAANGYGSLFIAVPDRDAIDVIDTRTLKAAGRIPLERCQGPTGLALDPVGRRLFVDCRSGAIAVVDTDVGFTFAHLPAAPGVARGLFVRAPAPGWKGAALFASAQGSLDAVRMLAFIRYADGGVLALPQGGEVAAFDPVHHRLWIAAAPRSGESAGKLLLLGAVGAAPVSGDEP